MIRLLLAPLLALVLTAPALAQSAAVAIAPEDLAPAVASGEPIRLAFTVSNPGEDALAGAVFVTVEAPDGEVVRRIENVTLASGEEKAYRFRETLALPAGTHALHVSVEAEDRSAVYARASASLTVE